MHKVSGTITVVPPFKLSLSVHFLEIFRQMSDEQELIDGSITKALMVRGQTILFKVIQTGTKDSDPVEYELISSVPLAKTVRENVINRISFFLSLKEDIAPFYEIAKKEDSVFYPVVKRFRGFHHVKFLTPFEAVTWAILAQRIPMPAAMKMKQRLVESYGSSIEFEGKKYWAFPDYSQLKDLTVKEIYAITGNRLKTEFLDSLFRVWKRIDESSLLKLDFGKAKDLLMEINGIGEWSATFILSRGLGRMEQLPKNMKTIIPEIHRMYGLDMPVEKINAIYGKWVGYWLLYLWTTSLITNH